MNDWLNKVAASQDDSTLSVLFARLLLAWVCGCIVGWIARRKKSIGTPDTLTLTLVMLSVLIAMATQIIGDNVARAFSLVGALSIVRFRTAVSSTRDVAFVLAAVVVGMAVGAGQYWVAGIGLAVVAMATHLNRSESENEEPIAPLGKQQTWRLTLQVVMNGSGDWEAELERLFVAHQLVSAETARRGGAMELIYRGVPKPGISAMEIVSALNAVPAVESVSTKAL